MGENKVIINDLKIKSLFSVKKIKVSKKEINAIVTPFFWALPLVFQLFLPPPTNLNFMHKSSNMTHNYESYQYSGKGTTNV